MKRRAHIVITIGDPSGIGPEVTVKAIKKLGRIKDAAFFIVGDSGILSRYGFRQGEGVYLIDLKTPGARHIRPGCPNARAARAGFEYLGTAVSLIKKGFGHGLVTAPIAKDGMRRAGFLWPGHTEYLAESFKARRTEMVFIGDRLKVALVTRHMSLKDVVRKLRAKEIQECGRIVFNLLRETFKIRKPRVAVCGLNPHAGEGGLFGREDILHIAPAIRELNKRFGPHFSGPWPADTVFIKAQEGAFDLVMAMYHDQGLAPFKSIEFDHGVNLTAGLPFVRTSPVHGTAFDIAGKNKADPRSMLSALSLAWRLTSASP